jgi:hypothetical protein
MGLSKYIFETPEVNQFLSHFPNQQWTQVCKATLLLGISRLEELLQRVGHTSLKELSLFAIEQVVEASQLKLTKQKTHKKKPLVAAKASSTWRRGSSELKN